MVGLSSDMSVWFGLDVTFKTNLFSFVKELTNMKNLVLCKDGLIGTVVLRRPWRRPIQTKD